MPTALVSLGVDFAFHAIAQIREQRTSGVRGPAAVASGLAAVLGALVLALASDAAAFLSAVVAVGRRPATGATAARRATARASAGCRPRRLTTAATADARRPPTAGVGLLGVGMLASPEQGEELGCPRPVASCDAPSSTW